MLVTALLGACTDLDLGGDTTQSTDELLILPLQTGTPAVQQSTFVVSNAELTVRRLLHADAFNTLYVEIRFPVGSLESLGGNPLSAADEVIVTLQPRFGGYGFTLSPDGVGFTSNAQPSVTLSFVRYGDLSAADGSPTYPDRAAYAAALRLWFEVTPGQWRRVDASTSNGSDAVDGPVAEPGTYVVAAVK